MAFELSYGIGATFIRRDKVVGNTGHGNDRIRFRDLGGVFTGIGIIVPVKVAFRQSGDTPITKGKPERALEVGDLGSTTEAIGISVRDGVDSSDKGFRRILRPVVVINL